MKIIVHVFFVRYCVTGPLNKHIICHLILGGHLILVTMHDCSTTTHPSHATLTTPPHQITIIPAIWMPPLTRIRSIKIIRMYLWVVCKIHLIRRDIVFLSYPVTCYGYKCRIIWSNCPCGIFYIYSVHQSSHYRRRQVLEYRSDTFTATTLNGTFA